MENNKLISVVLVVTVAVIMIGSLLMPIISSTQTVLVTKANNTTAYYTMDTVIKEELTFTYDVDSSTMFVNGEAIEWLNPGPAPSYRQMFIQSDKFGISFGVSHEAFTFASIDPVSNAAVKSVTVHEDGTWEATSIADEPIIGGSPVDWILYPSNDGEYGAYDLGFKASYDSDIFLAFTTADVTYEGSPGKLFAHAKMKNNVITPEYSKVILSDSTVVDVDLTYTMPESLDENGCIVYETGVYYANLGDISRSGVMFAPVEYTYKSASDVAGLNLINTIPIVLILSLLIAVAALFIRSRY